MPKAKNRRGDSTLEELIEEILVDSHGPDEQHESFVVALEDTLPCPFPARVIGEDVEVLGFEREGHSGGVLALCRRKGKKYRVSATSLEQVGGPAGRNLWIEAYKKWLGVKSPK